jgi:hypothetical protein
LRRVGAGLTFGEAEHALTRWIAEHPRVAWLATEDGETLERRAFETVSLPLNMTYNPHPFRSAPQALRKATREHAKQGGWHAGRIHALELGRDESHIGKGGTMKRHVAPVWAREIAQRGHQVRLMSPRFVQPYVKSNKNDARDAEAICEAVGRPSMRFVAVKS